LIIGFKTLVIVKGCVVVEVLIAFKVPPQSGFVEYVTSMALSLASCVTPIIDPERYWAPPKPYCEVVVLVVVVIPALQEKP
jgi:hypothetical protein